MVGGLIGVLIALALPKKNHIESTYCDIESLQDNSSVKGSFFLGCGEINNEMKYVMYLRSNDVFYMKEIPCGNASIQYVDFEPKLVKRSTVRDDVWQNYF